MQKNEEKLNKLLANILKISEKSINNNTSPDNTENWDSFNGLIIASEIEKEFKIKFDMEEVISTKNVGDIKKHLRNHGVGI